MTRTGVHQDKSTTTVFLCVENKAKTLGLRVSLEEILLPHPTFNPLFLSPLGIVGSSWTCLYSHPGEPLAPLPRHLFFPLVFLLALQSPRCPFGGLQLSSSLAAWGS